MRVDGKYVAVQATYGEMPKMENSFNALQKSVFKAKVSNGTPSRQWNSIGKPVTDRIRRDALFLDTCMNVDTASSRTT